MGFSTRGFGSEEDVYLHLHPHWWTFVRPSLIVVGGLLLVGISGGILRGDSWIESVLQTGALLLATFGLCQLGARFVSWRTTHFVVTNHRVIFQKGILGRQRLEIPIPRVNNVMFEQTFLERLVNCGDVIVESGGDDREVRFDNTCNPEDVQAQILQMVNKRD